VEIKQNLLADDAALDQTQTDASEDLRAAAQALLDQVQPHLSFEQGDVTMFVMDMPDVPPQYAPVVIAQASQAQKGDAKTDRTIGVCHLIQNPPIPALTAVNSLSPLGEASVYLENHEHLKLDWKSWKVSLLQGPEHGTLEMGERGGRYHPTPDYFGPDRATLLVEIGGHKVKVIYFFNVLEGVPGGTDEGDPHDDKEYCPQGKGRVWKISLNPDDPNTDLITFQQPAAFTSYLAQTIKVNQFTTKLRSDRPLRGCVAERN